MRILLGDKHQILLDGLSCLFSNCPDIEVVGQAENGYEAVTLAQGLAPDVVVLDLTMPELNGIDAARRIVQSLDCVRVLLLTTDPESEPVRAALDAGATGYISKACCHDELARALHAVAEGKIYLGPRAAAAVVAQTAGSDGTVGEPVYTKLSPREREVLRLLAEGHGSKQIAARLKISIKTVDTHRMRITGKLQADSLADLVKHALRAGLTDLEV